MKFNIKWLGHATTEITTANGTVIYIDPWFSHPLSKVSLDDIKKADVVLITHDHFDHTGDAGELLKKFPNAILAAQPELLGKIQAEFGIPDSQIVNGGGGMNIGGTVEICGVRITMTEAVHSSNTGEPSGFIVEIDGERIYHAGDTAIMATMEILGRLFPMKVALLPIGNVFTMDPVQAAEAAKMLKAENVIPIHYMTFPILEQSSDAFVKLANEIAPDTKVIPLAVGESAEF